MDFFTQHTIWSFYSSLAGTLSSVYLWCLLGFCIFFSLYKKKALMWLCVLVFITHLINHLVSDFLLTQYFAWNIAWMVSDFVLVFAVYKKALWLNQTLVQDISIITLALISSTINFLRYIERLADYHDVSLFFTIKNFYGVGVNTVNLLGLIVLSYPAAKLLMTHLKDLSNGVVFTSRRNAKHSGNSSSN